uniref:Pat2 n=1 Tax=Tetrahymena thermophila TaxID=5911 RepID=A0A097I997_TETTH|nr:Pat2 [Tetrahymena thermophila]
MLYNQINQVRPISKYYQNASTNKSNQSIAKNRYASLYQRALNDKIKQQLIKQQYEIQPSKSTGKGDFYRHTPSSASIQVTTLDLIEFVLGEYEQNNPVMLKPINVKDTYTIYEDLKIIYCLGCKEDQITKSQFQKLAEEGYVNRTYESIRSRYQDYLKFLTSEDYQNILSYIDANGLKGYLIFEKDEKGERFLQRIQKQDPRQNHQSESSKAALKGSNNLQVGSNHNLSATHTPVRSPRINSYEDRPHSPNIFSFSPSKRSNVPAPIQNMHNGFMPYYMPGYSYPMFPQQQMGAGADNRLSPYKPAMFFDPQTHQPMMFPPYYMNPYMYGQVPYPQFVNQGKMQNEAIFDDQEEERNDQVQFEVRPSLKKSTIKQKEVDMEDEDEIPEQIQKKKKKNNQQDEKKVAQVIQPEQQKQNLKQEKKQQNQQQIVEKSQPVNTNVQQQPPKIQTTLVLPKFQGLQINKQPFVLPQTGLDQANKSMTREVFDLISDDDRIPEDQFESMMQYVAEQIKMPIEKVIDILDCLSGSFKDFSVYVETKQENMLWNPEEDKILSNIKSQDSSEFKLLSKLKGISSIKKRVLYNNLDLPFPIV